MRILLITDIDGTFYTPNLSNYIDDFINLLEENKDKIIFGLSSGRSFESIMDFIAQYNLEAYIDYIFPFLGTEIFDNRKKRFINKWNEFISYNWDRNKVINIINKEIPSLELQPKSEQSEYKVSYFAYNDFSINRLIEVFRNNRVYYSFSFSHNIYLDIVPYRAIPKANSIYFLSKLLNIKYNNIYTIGDSLNDYYMLFSFKSFIVRNHTIPSEYINPCNMRILKTENSLLEVLDYIVKEIL